MTTWIDLCLRFQKNKMEQLTKLCKTQKTKKEHWRELLRRLICIVKYLAKYTLSFCGKNNGVYQESNVNFMNLGERMAESDPLMNHHQRLQNT